MFMESGHEQAIFLLDRDGIVTYGNAGALDILGCLPGELIQQPFTRFCRPEDIGNCELEKELAAAAEEGHVDRDWWHVREDGTRIWCHDTTTPLHDELGQVCGYMKVVREIETARGDADPRIEQLHRRSDELLKMLAHELRVPLAPVRHAPELLGQSGADGTVQPAHTQIEEQIEHMAGLVDNLLDASRIMRGQLTLQREPVELATVINRAVETSQTEMDHRRHQLTLSVTSEPVWLDADQVRLSQVLSNLLDNAARYTDSGGKIRLAAWREASQVVISVRDNGRGIEPQLLPRVFDLFEQAAQPTGRREGLGIGLMLVRSLVELHGGQVVARSGGPGKGSEFIVRLPALSRSPKWGTREPVKPADRKLRVLVVEDMVSSAQVLSAMLQRLWGHDVEVVHDGVSAIEKARATHPDLVLLDIGLPELDGFEVARQLRQDHAFDDLLVAALTGYGQEEDRRRGQEVGFDEHLIKPVSVTELERVFMHPKLTRVS